MTTLMQLIERYCPNGVEYVKLGELEDRGDVKLGRGKVISKKIMSEHPGDYPVYSSSAATNGLFGTYGDYMFADERITWSVDGGGKFFYRPAHKYSVTNVCGWMKTTSDSVTTKYLYYALYQLWTDELFDYTRKAHPSVIREVYQIPLPPSEVQDAIVERLDAFAKLIESLDSEIALREKRFEHFREQLLTFVDSAGVEHVKLGDVAESVKSGATPKARTAEYYDNGTIPWLRTNEVKFNTITSTEMMVTEKALAETPIKWIEAPSVVVAISGATAGRSAIIATPVTTNQHCCCLHFDETIVDYRFVFNSLALRYEELKSLGRGARGDLNAGIIKNFQIPLPSLEVQQDIVDKLDTMQALIDNLKQERDLRRTQFEYYREKLLTFNS